MQRRADVVIAGGGVTGSSILYQLAVRGVGKAVLIERDVVGGGSTGRSLAICRMHYSNPVTASMAWESLRVFREFSGIVGGSAGFVNTGYLLVVGPEDLAAMEQNVAMQQELGISTGVVSAEDVAELAPMLDVADAGGLAYEPDSGYCDPYLVTSSNIERALEMGGSVHSGVAVTGIRLSKGEVSAVVTSQGTIETPVAVVAAGPWSRPLLGELGIDIPLETVRHQVVAVRRPEKLVPEHPSVGDIARRMSFRPDSSNLTLVGIGDSPAEPDTYNPGVDHEAMNEAFDGLVRRVPGMSRGFVRGGWSGLFTVTPDWHPILDRIEGIDGLYCSVGFSGHGFKLSPMVGVAMTELILDGRSHTVDVSPLRISRYREGDVLSSQYQYQVLA